MITSVLNEYKYYFGSCNIVALGYTFNTSTTVTMFEFGLIRFELNLG